MQLDAAGLFLVVLGQVFVFGNVDGVFDGVAVVGQADIAVFQPLPVGGEIEGIACLPVGAAFGLQVEFGIVGFQQVDVGGGCFVNAGEASRLREAGEQAAVVGQVVADGDGRRPCMGADRFGLCPVLLLGIIALKDAVLNLIRANWGEVSHLTYPKHRTAGPPFIAFMRMIEPSRIVALCPIAVIAPV